MENNISSIKELSNSVEKSLLSIETYLCSNGANIIFCGGDSLLANSDELINIPKNILIIKNMSFSVGIGDSPSYALLALKKAKGLGKKRTEMIIGLQN